MNNIQENEHLQPTLGFGIDNNSGPQTPVVKIAGVRDSIQTKLKTTMKRKAIVPEPQTTHMISSDEEDVFVPTTSKVQNTKTTTNQKQRTVVKKVKPAQPDNDNDDNTAVMETVKNMPVVQLKDFFLFQNVSNVEEDHEAELDMIALSMGCESLKEISTFQYPLRSVIFMLLYLNQNFQSILMNVKTLEKIVKSIPEVLQSLVEDWTDIEISEQCAQSSLNSLWAVWPTYVKKIIRTTTLPYEKWHTTFILNLEEPDIDISPTSLYRRDMLILRQSLVDLATTPNFIAQIRNSFLSQNTTTTSMSATPVHTQMQLAAVPGLRPAKHGGSGDERSIVDAYSRMTSRLTAGQGSFVISCNLAESPFTTKADVMMEDYVFDLKVYK